MGDCFLKLGVLAYSLGKNMNYIVAEYAQRFIEKAEFNPYYRVSCEWTPDRVYNHFHLLNKKYNR